MPSWYYEKVVEPRLLLLPVVDTFSRLLYLFSYGKEHLFSFKLALCNFTLTKFE